MGGITDTYELVLRAFAARHRNGDAAVLAKELQGLQSAVVALWDAFNQDILELDYRGDLAEAYVLKYYPAYAELLSRLLTAVEFTPRAPSLRVLVLGAGPAPEVLAVERYLRESHPSVTRCVFTLVDLNLDGWSPMLNRLLEEISSRSSIELGWASVQGDLTDPHFGRILPSLFGNADLIMMQNLLNEIPARAWPAFTGILAEASRNLRGDASFIAVDLAATHQNGTRLAELAKRLAEVSELEQPMGHSFETERVGEDEDLPSLLRSNLLVGRPYSYKTKLQPKKWVRFNAFLASGKALAGSRPADSRDPSDCPRCASALPIVRVLSQIFGGPTPDAAFFSDSLGIEYDAAWFGLIGDLGEAPPDVDEDDHGTEDDWWECPDCEAVVTCSETHWCGDPFIVTALSNDEWQRSGSSDGEHMTGPECGNCGGCEICYSPDDEELAASDCGDCGACEICCDSDDYDENYDGPRFGDWLAEWRDERDGEVHDYLPADWVPEYEEDFESPW